ncbi:MAG: hypothetical protein AAF490_21700 [Chloroflexota bacterium]
MAIPYFEQLGSEINLNTTTKLLEMNYPAASGRSIKAQKEFFSPQVAGYSTPSG